MNKTPTAWMLRRDGIAFPCQWHYYGNADPAEVEETLYAAEWLYDATQSEETRRRCLDLTWLGPAAQSGGCGLR